MSRSALASFRIAGLLWALTFGSLALVFYTQSVLEKNIQQSITEQGTARFVRLIRLQRKKKSLLPSSAPFIASPEVDYFYTYSYLHNGRTYTVTEQVPVDLYYLHREGENLEATLFTDTQGYPHTRLEGNPYNPEKSLLPILSSALALFGLLLSAVGFLWRKR